MQKVALITGATGQVGRHLTELLLEKGYEVHGLIRRVSYPTPFDLNPDVHLHTADLTDSSSLERVLCEVLPHEIYNLAAMSDVHESFVIPEYTGDVAGLGVTRMLEAARAHTPDARIYQAGTSEMFGSSPPPQNENTAFRPNSPYAIAKLYGHHMAVAYRNGYGMFVANGILFNHESKFRGHQFVTRKITRGLARVAAGLQECLCLGNLDAERDWGHAADYVRAQWLMLQHPQPTDFVIATGVMRSVREFANIAAQMLGLELVWCGQGTDEVAVNRMTGKPVIRVDKALFRPNEVERLCGDSTKARQMLGWQPEMSFEDLVREMVEHDRAEAERSLGRTA